MKIILLSFLLFCFSHRLNAQLKFVVEDFEGQLDGALGKRGDGIFTYGNIKASIETTLSNHLAYSGERSIRLSKEGNLGYGGWGKGIGASVELDPATDFLNFFVYHTGSLNADTLKIEIQDDDNSDDVFNKDHDDSWVFNQSIGNKNAWELISIPLNKLIDSNRGGDNIFNLSSKSGKLICLIFNFSGPNKIPDNESWNFDFISFSKGKLKMGSELFDSPPAGADDLCSLGAWSKEGIIANFSDIAHNFEKIFRADSDKKLAVVHFFQPFAADGGNKQNLLPSVERINKLIKDGYIPMITLEDHFVHVSPDMKQPNLYSIVEGHFDSFFVDWAKKIKQLDGMVLLRILHEFNGNWYPWCISKNDNDPQLLIKAYRHIHGIFDGQHVKNAKFIWCPNSMSIPDEKWNYIMDAYPGDKYVDYLGLDIYNGAGAGFSVWRSFRKEGMTNYFILTQMLPDKPLFICETASRERMQTESSRGQNKAEWIKQMSIALKTDMSKIRLLTWFNEKDLFKINSSDESQRAFLNFFLKDPYFKSGTSHIFSIHGWK